MGSGYRAIYVAPDGTWNHVDPRKHVVLRDPDTNRIRVFERSADMDESAFLSVGRLILPGFTAPVTAPIKGAAAATSGAAKQILTTDGLPASAKNAGNPAKSLASTKAEMYNPPPQPQRAFEKDYPLERWPKGPPHNPVTGRLTRDIEGRRLVAKRVVGRRVVGGHDEAFPTAELDAFTKAGTGRGAQTVSPSEMGQDLGNTLINPYTGKPEGVRLASDLTPEDALIVHAHENAHIIDELAKQIPTDGLMDELGRVYNTLNNPNRTPDGADAASWAKIFRPEDAGYESADIAREYMVEAIRAYMKDPNYLKTVARKTAERIRAHVNAHPQLSKHIQFNTLVPMAAGGALGAAAAFDERDSLGAVAVP